MSAMEAPATNTPKPQPEQVEIFLPSTLGYEKVARNAAEAVAEEMGFSPDRIEDLKTAISEACMNAIEHGNQEDKTTSVTVLLTAAPKQLEIKVAEDRKSTRLNSSHVEISYAVFCLKKKKKKTKQTAYKQKKASA